MVDVSVLENVDNEKSLKLKLNQLYFFIDILLQILTQWHKKIV